MAEVLQVWVSYEIKETQIVLYLEVSNRGDFVINRIELELRAKGLIFESNGDCLLRLESLTSKSSQHMEVRFTIDRAEANHDMGWMVGVRVASDESLPGSEPVEVRSM